MPRAKWSAHDERKYESILTSCKLAHARKKKGGTAQCKRIAAATVNRDRALGELGLAGGVPPIPGLFAPPLRGDRGDAHQRANRMLYENVLAAKREWEAAADRWDAEHSDAALVTKRTARERLEDAERQAHQWRQSKTLGGGVPPIPGLFAPPLRGALSSTRVGKKAVAYVVHADTGRRKFTDASQARAYAKGKTFHGSQATVDPLYKFRVEYRDRGDRDAPSGSAIITSYDAESAEERFLESSYDQGYPDHEVTSIALAGLRGGEREAALLAEYDRGVSQYREQTARMNQGGAWPQIRPLAPYRGPVLIVDDEHVTDLPAFLWANREAMDLDEMRQIQRLAVGETYEGGGGAAASFTVKRLRGLKGTVKQHRARAAEQLAKGEELLPLSPQVADQLAIAAMAEQHWVPRDPRLPPGLDPVSLRITNLHMAAQDRNQRSLERHGAEAYAHRLERAGIDPKVLEEFLNEGAR